MLGIGSLGLPVPCRVVWAVEEERRAGFAYGTLPGHPERGEEAFVVDLAPDGAVWFTVRAVSRPAAWYMQAAGPLGRLGQRIFARRYGSALERLAAEARQMVPGRPSGTQVCGRTTALTDAGSCRAAVSASSAWSSR